MNVPEPVHVIWDSSDCRIRGGPQNSKKIYVPEPVHVIWNSSDCKIVNLFFPFKFYFSHENLIKGSFKFDVWISVEVEAENFKFEAWI